MRRDPGTHHSWVRLLVTAALVLTMAWAGPLRSAVATTAGLTPDPAPTSCPVNHDGDNPEDENNPGPWCLWWNDQTNSGATQPTLGVYSMHLSPTADSVVTISFPLGGCGCNLGGISSPDDHTNFHPAFLRDSATDRRAYTQNGVYLSQDQCGDKQSTCTVTVRSWNYPQQGWDGPRWVFGHYFIYNGDQSTVVADSEFAIKMYAPPLNPKTTTAVACKDKAAGLFSCTATVAKVTGGDTPTGTVHLATTAGALSADTCTLSHGKCTVTYTPTVAANEKKVTISADYTSDTALTASAGKTTIAAITLDGTAKKVHTYLAYTAHAVFTLKLSRASNHPVKVHVQTHDGTGRKPAHAAEGDYKKVNRTVTFPAGTTTTEVEVAAYPQVDVRKNVHFALELSDVNGAIIAVGASSKAAGFVRDDGIGTKLIKETIDPDLVTGVVTHVRWKRNDIAVEPRVYVERYKTHKRIRVHVGTKLYVGDELYTETDTVAAIHFVLGGGVGVDENHRVRVVNERFVEVINGTAYDVVRRQIGIWTKVATQKTPLIIQTNGGVMGQKG